ncbi:molybdopterin-guanine dinucleotide biosynthesis protein B [Symbiobacterium thermophilum]|jgi:molybdopterin-guanine dinucleotide biosynthesis protein B|uniref:Molybdopterin-guanine dinucleotide biosynthesis protein B n=1 Tax=Symbiobacterium thermophilum TaxID=2734 RepID=A0A953LIL5_SYMTR|nr:molybdopterin-guanine dinucleotide biosynthesis protein B [Symbiobacterium thermophilum]MBY6276199.1 molybdopterin-guanine dinucleotide biosynthesis protein B [Symbiobacterium thermophilum]
MTERPPVLSIVGCGKCGKTTLVERLVAELTRRGWSVGTLKHDVHGFQMDHEGKDTWRHRQAGAKAVCIIGPGQIGLVRSVPEGEFSTADAIALLGSVDLVITEGFKRERFPKIEIFSSARNEGHLLCGEDPTLIAVAGDLPVQTALPRFDWNDIVAIADFVEMRLLRDAQTRS